ncbi:MAG: dTMP kinase [Actinomycetia bacterium]|nr:dTMP kinase [Actinomycetes bacterium]
MGNGVFITFEGTEASGKSTQIKLLGEYLEKKGYDIALTRDPGGTRVGDKIRKILLNPSLKEIDFKLEALLYASSRAQLISEVIQPSLSENKVVICDRYIDSSLAYQVFGRGLPYNMIYELNQWATGDIWPDITFWMALKPEVAEERKELSDRMEKSGIQFHKKVFEGYEKLIKNFPDRIKKINALKDIGQIHKEIVTILEKGEYLKKYDNKN